MKAYPTRLKQRRNETKRRSRHCSHSLARSFPECRPIIRVEPSLSPARRINENPHHVRDRKPGPGRRWRQRPRSRQRESRRQIARRSGRRYSRSDKGTACLVSLSTSPFHSGQSCRNGMPAIGGLSMRTGCLRRSTGSSKRQRPIAMGINLVALEEPNRARMIRSVAGCCT